VTRKFTRKVSQRCDLPGLSRHNRKSCFNPSLDIQSCQAFITSLSGRPIEDGLQCNSRVASQDVQQSAFAGAGWPHDGRQFSWPKFSTYPMENLLFHCGRERQELVTVLHSALMKCNMVSQIVGSNTTYIGKYFCNKSPHPIFYCTVHRYTHKQDWINMRPQDRTILITK